MTMTSIDLLAKADRALSSAKLLLASGDIDGACNRAYYAAFDAARAALATIAAPVHAEDIRTHRGLIAAFGLHVVKSGSLSPETGRTLNKLEDLRLAADYADISIDESKGTWAVEQASLLVESVRRLVQP